MARFRFILLNMKKRTDVVCRHEHNNYHKLLSDIGTYWGLGGHVIKVAGINTTTNLNYSFVC